MNKHWFVIIGVVLLAAGISVGIWIGYVKYSFPQIQLLNGSSGDPFPCDQSATTTDCTKIISESGIKYPAPPSMLNPNDFNPVASLEYVPLPITPPIKVDTSDWKEYVDEKYGVTIKYPRSWTLETQIIDGGEVSGIAFMTSVIRIKRSAYVLSISLVGGDINLSGGGLAGINISDYVSFPMASTVISRSTISEQTEIGHHTYLYICHIQTNAEGKALEHGAPCDNPVLINNVFLGINYSLDSGDKFDKNILNEMDAILQHITVK